MKDEIKIYKKKLREKYDAKYLTTKQLAAEMGLRPNRISNMKYEGIIPEDIKIVSKSHVNYFRIDNHLAEYILSRSTSRGQS